MFYTFSQNNSGGSFKRDDHVCEYVIVEADSAKDANTKAEEVGIYFNGCDDGTDCSCCGDRWYEQWNDSDGTELPSIYGTPVTELTAGFFRKQAYVYYKDGRKEAVVFPD
ncbi:hypothetical protein MKY59_21630 [Paenibacillus sp. FSL W8-0426]|uniref:DUF7296 family protein n=1 Tax=Paenibacillus sp. FSL W8-0426 TaxID=2921714 RepID=UPI0030DD97DC